MRVHQIDSGASRRNRVPPVPRLALSKAEAAEALGVSVDFFDEHIAHELCVVRKGRRRLIPVSELERWLQATAARWSEAG